MISRVQDLVLASTRDVAELLGVPTGTVHRWAHEDGWGRYGSRVDRRWDLDQAQASYDRRRSPGLTT